MPKTKPVLLVVLDGWGIREEREANAIAMAGTPNVDALVREFPSTAIETSGLSVGLPDGQMGNSEVGHTNLGAGRIVYQDLVRINRAVEDGSFFGERRAAARLPAREGVGRRAPPHGPALRRRRPQPRRPPRTRCLELARREGVARALRPRVHGRPRHAAEVGPRLPGRARAAAPRARATARSRPSPAATGRWTATSAGIAWRSRTPRSSAARGSAPPPASRRWRQSYARGRDRRVREADGRRGRRREAGRAGARRRRGRLLQLPRGPRARDHPRLHRSGASRSSSGWPAPRLAAYVCMTEYDRTFGLPVAFGPTDLTEIFPEIVSRAGLKQLRCAETEKYAHVTFFFNGGREQVFPGEDRILVPSPRDVKTYDQKPEMSAPEVTDEARRRHRHRPVRLHPRELREPGHGRPHRAPRRRGEGGEGGRRVRRPALAGGARGRGWRCSSPPTTATAR